MKNVTPTTDQQRGLHHRGLCLPLFLRSQWLQIRLRGSRKVPPRERVSFVLNRFFDLIEWLDLQGPTFFDRLRRAVER